jgi:hypothetical protein
VVLLVRDFLQACLDRSGYHPFLTVSLIYTPFDLASNGWAGRMKDGTASVTWSLTDADYRNDVLLSVTYNDLIRPDTVAITGAEGDGDQPGNGFSVTFTAQTTAGEPVSGRAAGSYDHERGGGTIGRLTYHVSTP